MIQIAVCLAESEGNFNGITRLEMGEVLHRKGSPKTHKSLRKNGAWDCYLSFREGLFSGTITLALGRVMDCFDDLTTP